MGDRGKLKLVDQLTVVPAEVAKGSAAADVQALAPQKPRTVASNQDLSDAWDTIVPELDRAGLVSVADGPAIEAALMHFVLMRKAFFTVGDDVMVEDRAHMGVKKHPAEAVVRLESEMFLKYAQQLGMTFVSRARTPGKGADDGGAQANPFAPTGS